jgi:NitT/TauT family transport system permease protein
VYRRVSSRLEVLLVHPGGPYCLEIFSSGAMFADVLATVFRILAGLAGAFIVGGPLALMMMRSRAVDQFLSPILTLFQGIPALSWVVFAIIWFHGVEPRIFLIMVMTTLPGCSCSG